MKKIFLFACILFTFHFTEAQTVEAKVTTTAKQDAAKLDPRMNRKTPLDSNSSKSSKKYKRKSSHKPKKHKMRKSSDD